MVLRGLLVEADDSTRQIIAALLRKCSYLADFLIKPVRRNELRNLWQHVWRRHMLAVGCAPHNLPTSEHKVAATAKNNDESNQSNDYGSSTQKIKDESDTQDQMRHMNSSIDGVRRD